ncbi:metal-dependent hydrolase [Haloarculaceae archaeon H-GB1-1]|nr:metal-dependent hydrolase [Haloarculaceae archaeon H-GB1-1]
MWPWEHLAFGYVLYSLLARTHPDWRPTTLATGVLVVATQLPDLVDKPLGWVFDVFQSGNALGHSVLVAAPASLLVLVGGIVFGRRDVAVAFVVGYGSHLLGDVLYPLVTRGTVPLAKFLWPVVVIESPTDVGVLPRVEVLFEHFLELLAGPNGWVYLLLELGLLAFAASLWALDGFPLVRPFVRSLRPDRSHS